MTSNFSYPTVCLNDVAEWFKFTRDDLRLTFREVPALGEDTATRDNIDQYTCTQPEHHRRTEDVMCYKRPHYLPEYQNPCYREATTDQLDTGRIRCLPYFHILGVDKSGTTDFFSRLVAHPQILNNSGELGKETSYWAWLRYGLWNHKKRRKWRLWKYVRYFDKASSEIQASFVKHNQQLITGDGTPMDFWDFRGWTLDPQNAGLTEPRVLTPHLMRHLYKNPKFILLFRDPVDRLYSDYIFLGYGFTAEKFARDVPKAIAMLRYCLQTNTTRQCFFSDWMYHRLPMRIHTSCYSVFLREWLSVFHRNHFLVLRTEDYHSNMKATLEQTFRFLQVAPLSDPDLDDVLRQQMKHETYLKKTAGDMYPETRALLEEFFAPFNQDLTRLLQDDKFLWKDQPRSRSSATR
ncbi:carbohydrate sulfotransferase 15-like [Physella acuta]|uniref:carbohydrate sulfotransferase 15-like n=1 Tax=Physella acuta TaxID=109671 RepID=UPI0027DE7378|nr:carbohydrate sulfotransferase 15-like [Physella acuta]